MSTDSLVKQSNHHSQNRTSTKNYLNTDNK